ncbi:2-dehydropantoate 2-reductase N-terminal domain-containing protein [Paenibacillus sp. TAB 01]|uniref:2-dehydropantoate 2-reductase N-terminal domain-containing protein n=1 Tax=Paenibacillus sp. TAB 01 TaxID=3368988 RepID=UPI00374FF358
MRLEIIGAGAMGMLLAAALLESGAEVTLIARTCEQAEAIRAGGLLWPAPWTERSVPPRGRRTRQCIRRPSIPSRSCWRRNRR